jgi:hypothetical protein
MPLDVVVGVGTFEVNVQVDPAGSLVVDIRGMTILTEGFRTVQEPSGKVVEGPDGRLWAQLPLERIPELTPEGATCGEGHAFLASSPISYGNQAWCRACNAYMYIYGPDGEKL